MCHHVRSREDKVRKGIWPSGTGLSDGHEPPCGTQTVSSVRVVGTLDLHSVCPSPAEDILN